MTVARMLYSAALYLGMPLLLLRLLWRSRQQSAYLRHIGERFGLYHGCGDHHLIWVHAVSVGETRAAEPLVRALQAQYPQYRILLTHMTPTGREAGRDLFGNNVAQCYLPYDFPGAVARFFRHFQPVAGLLIETEIWPNLIAAGTAAKIPLYLVNARLSAKSQQGYRRLGALAVDAIRGFAAVSAQSEADAERLRALGAVRVTVTGNLKYDVEPDAELLKQGEALRQLVGRRPMVLAASTREGEEVLLLDAAKHAGLQNTLLVIVPRHPQRFEAVADLAIERGLRLQRRSEGRAIEAQTDVLLGDSMGEMFAYYAACDVVLMGGSFLDYGAQNLIEPCALGKPVIIGPSTFNFAEAAAAASAAGAALSVGDAAAGLAQALALAGDAMRCRQMGDAGQAYTAAHRGATRRVMTMLQPIQKQGPL